MSVAALVLAIIAVIADALTVFLLTRRRRIRISFEVGRNGGENHE